VDIEFMNSGVQVRDGMSRVLQHEVGSVKTNQSQKLLTVKRRLNDDRGWKETTHCINAQASFTLDRNVDGSWFLSYLGPAAPVDVWADVEIEGIRHAALRLYDAMLYDLVQNPRFKLERCEEV